MIPEMAGVRGTSSKVDLKCISQEDKLHPFQRAKINELIIPERCVSDGETEKCVFGECLAHCAAHPNGERDATANICLLVEASTQIAICICGLSVARHLFASLERGEAP